MPGKHSVRFLVKQVINTGMAGKRVGYMLVVSAIRHLTVAIR